MTVSATPVSAVRPIPSSASFDDFEKGTLGGFSPPAKDSLRFADLLDVVNPLQHIPVVSTVYRNLTGDTIKPIAQVAGGLLYGGPSGAVVAGVMAGLQEAASAPASAPTSVAAASAAEGGEGPPLQLKPAAEAASVPAPAAAAAKAVAAVTPAQQSSVTAAESRPAAAAQAAPRPASAGRDIQSYMNQAIPAVRSAPAASAPAIKKTGDTSVPAPAVFSDRMLNGLDKYRAMAGTKAPAKAAAAVEPQG